MRAKLIAADHVAKLRHFWMETVIVPYRERDARTAHGSNGVLGLAFGQRERLLGRPCASRRR